MSEKNGHAGKSIAIPSQLDLIDIVINSSVDYICAIDKEERFIIFNNRYEKLTGLKREVALGKKVVEIFPHLENSEALAAFRRAIGGEVVHHDKYLSAITNRYYENYFLPLRAGGNEVYGALLIGHDINDRILAQEELLKVVNQLKTSEERYHSMINEVEDYAILLLSKEGNIENWNKGAEKIKGYPASEIMGKNFRIFYTQNDRNNNLPESLLEKARTTGKAAHEGWRVRKDGTIFWGSTTITALHNAANEVTGFSKVTRDLTLQKIAQDKLRFAADQLAIKNKELERSNNELTSFSYVASHDLQEPLRKIKTFGKLIMEKEVAKLSDSGKEYFTRMINAADRMKELMDALLEFSRVNTNKGELQLSDLNALVEEVRKDMSETIEARKAIVECSALPQLNVIPFQFKQLLANLIGNAIKYSKPDEPPVIRVLSAFAQAGEIQFKSALPGVDYYVLTVADNGIGFENENAEKIFELFQRLHGKSEYSGSGIGLSICKKIAQNHGGFIVADSEPGKGSSFHIYIPTVRANMHT